MADDFYSAVKRRLWFDARFRALSKPEPNARDMFLYLLTTPAATQIPGLLAIGEAAMADDLDWPVDGVRAAMAELVASGIVLHDRTARLIWLPNAMKHNAPRSPDNVKGWAKHWRMLPECALRAEAGAAMMATFIERGGTFAAAFATASGLPMPSAKDTPKPDPQPTPDPKPNPKGGPKHHAMGGPPPRHQYQDQDQDQTHTSRARVREEVACQGGATPPPPTSKAGHGECLPDAPPLPSMPLPDNAAALVAALKSHPVIVAAAEAAPMGLSALTNLVEGLEGRRIASGRPTEWIVVAIADAARDIAAESSGAGLPPWADVAKRIVRYADHAKRPRAEIDGREGDSRAASSPKPDDGPFTADEQWVSERWREARRRQGLPAGEPSAKQVRALWAKSVVRCNEATPDGAGWRPQPREDVAHCIRLYLAEPATRAGDAADQGYPLGLLVARMNEAYALPKRGEGRAPSTSPPLTADDLAPVVRPPPPSAETLQGLLALRTAGNGAPPPRRMGGA